MEKYTSIYNQEMSQKNRKTSQANKYTIKKLQLLNVWNWDTYNRQNKRR